MKKQYIVNGWLNGADYEKGNPSNCAVFVMATNESEADELGDKKITKQFQKCEVIVSELNKERVELTKAYLKEQGRIEFND